MARRVQEQKEAKEAILKAKAKKNAALRTQSNLTTQFLHEQPHAMAIASVLSSSSSASFPTKPDTEDNLNNFMGTPPKSQTPRQTATPTPTSTPLKRAPLSQPAESLTDKYRKVGGANKKIDQEHMGRLERSISALEMYNLNKTQELDLYSTGTFFQLQSATQVSESWLEPSAPSVTTKKSFSSDMAASIASSFAVADKVTKLEDNIQQLSS